MSFPNHAYDTIIFDIGDVLCTKSLESSHLSQQTLKRVLSSTLWANQEKGILDQQSCYAEISRSFQLDPEHLRLAIQDVRQSITFIPEMVSLLQELKARNHHIRLYAASNITRFDFEYTSGIFDYSVFDGLYPSHVVGERKPALDFYRRVLEELGGDPARMIFIDDKEENVMAAASFGIHGIVFKDAQEVKMEISKLLIPEME
ncbi:hypothetical protein VKT23_008620 [Stygiomarasmius scandens]|uniref:Uncharacterized protein n=1 Tax=Marasmiellus scandens TaxID=2682957 RepID=A0ABR1JK80_9AGAR